MICSCFDPVQRGIINRLKRNCQRPCNTEVGLNFYIITIQAASGEHVATVQSKHNMRVCLAVYMYIVTLTISKYHTKMYRSLFSAIHEVTLGSLGVMSTSGLGQRLLQESGGSHHHVALGSVDGEGGGDKAP